MPGDVVGTLVVEDDAVVEEDVVVEDDAVVEEEVVVLSSQNHIGHSM